MAAKPAAVVTFIIAAGVCVAGWVALPMLREPQQKVESEASLHLERARRLLNLYSPTATFNNLIVEQLHAAQPESNGEGLSESAGEIYQGLHESLWTDFQPLDWSQTPPRPVKPTYSNVEAQAREGLKARVQFQTQNKQLLKDAMAEVDEALSVEAGEASGRNLAQANRLKGVVLFHQASAEQLRALLDRAELEPSRRRLTELAATTSAMASLRNLLEHSAIEERIREVKQKMSEAQDVLKQDQKGLAGIESKIAGLEKNLAAANSRIQKAREEMEKLSEAGLNFALPNAMEDFEQRYSEQDQISRSAQREAQLLESGGLPKAEIDASGDFLKGKYLENGSALGLTPEFGLAHFRTEQAAMAAVVERGKQGVDDFVSDLARLEGMRDAYRAAEENAAEQLELAAKSTTEAYDEFSKRQSELAVIEDTALKLFDQAASAFQQAASLADQWVTDARERGANVSPEAKEFSAWTKREGDGWISAYIAAHVADARLAKTRILFERHEAHRHAAATLETISRTLDLKEVDPAAEAQKAAQAKAQAFEEITKAMAVLEKSHKNADKNWTFVAQAAAANDLLALFGDADYATDAIESYRNAIKGRETEPANAVFAARLKNLEARQ